MVSITDRDDDGLRPPPAAPSGPPVWTGWLQIGLSTMLAVLFLVMLTKSREQSQRLMRLEQRLQGLENSRALDRTSVLEEQQRAMVGRLQTLEAGAQRLEALERQQEQWRAALADIQGRAVRRPPADADPFPVSPMPSSGPGGRSGPAPADRSDGGVLRPPAPGNP
ncbi:lipase chaperone [Synechococcus sp. CS-1332]|uniref:lipase chaperone n=1 Tax=Synechococcus sp. CS-1332 TaxID=2847972 RepID=UPI00223AE911|nr:lipase chaperone [Synechococcus sp. CS-1332]MCT0207895.1 lipase chaperone [Synechococcus sp. CS-1332]